MSNDFISRSELLCFLNGKLDACLVDSPEASTVVSIMEFVEGLPPVRPGAVAEAMIVENPDWELYTEYRGDKPVAYRYGPEWVGMQLYVEGGYKTPEEAKLRWLEYWEATK